MKKICQKSVSWLFLVFCVMISVNSLLWITGCSRKGLTEKEKEIEEEKPTKQPTKHPEGIGVSDDFSKAVIEERDIYSWTVYWDNGESLEDMDKLTSNIIGISYFAAYFDKNKELFIPESALTIRQEIEDSYGKNEIKSYLTFVNDLLKPEGGSSLKDTKLLYQLFSKEKDRKNHIDKIIQTSLEEGFDGIEIDYEAIKKDMDLWKLFCKFIEELYKETTKQQLALRVLLEPGAPIDKIQLPKGPEYVVMCYNLHGYGTKAGPKADRAFLEKMVAKMEGLNKGEIGFAVASGGFSFSASGIVKQMTTDEAIEKSKLSEKEPYRDKKSGCLVYTYIDEENIKQEVWYADEITIDYWLDILENAGGKNLYLWRLGG